MLFKLMRLPDTPGAQTAALPMAAACFNTLKCARRCGHVVSARECYD